jgi:hypothetical protein
MFCRGDARIEIALTLSDLCDHFGEAIRGAATETARKHSAEEWVAGACKQE